MAIKIKADKLKQGLEKLIANVENAAAEVEHIKNMWELSPEYKEDQIEKAQEKYKAALKDLTDSMRNQIQSDVSAASKAVSRSLDYAAETYHAMTVKQEIDGLDTKQLMDRYEDIAAEGDTSRKKHFERLAVAAMKNNGDMTEASIFQKKVYENMDEIEKDDIDTRTAAEKYLYNVDIIERQAGVLLNDALDGRKLDATGLTTIWEEGSANAERNHYV